MKSLVPRGGQHIHEIVWRNSIRIYITKSFLWLRYVDDTFILWPHQEDVQTLLDHVNSIWLSIQFTMKKEQDNKLSLLGVLLTHTGQGFRSSVYWKPNFNSHHQCKERNCLLPTTLSKSHYYWQWCMSPPSQQLPRKHNIGSKKSGLNNREQYPKIHHSLSAKGLAKKIYSPYAIKTIFRSGTTLLSQTLQQNTWPRIACTPSHAVVVRYTKARHATH